MNAQLVGILLATHVGIGVYSDILGYQTALKEYEESRRRDPITCGDEPTFKWKLFGWRIAGGLVAAALAMAGVNNTQPTGGAQ